MNSTSDFRKGRHCVFALHAHLVFVTKYRKRIFTKPVIDYLENTFKEVCRKFEVELVECDGENDHIHLLVNYPPKVSLSKLVNSLKGVSSRRLRQKYPQLQNSYRKNVLWSPSYFAGS